MNKSGVTVAQACMQLFVAAAAGTVCYTVSGLIYRVVVQQLMRAGPRAAFRPKHALACLLRQLVISYVRYTPNA
jgi:hypothetical protein